MTWYFQYLDLEAWKTILYGFNFPIKNVDENKIQKHIEENK